MTRSSYDIKAEKISGARLYRAREALRRFNLKREDIVSLKSGATVSVKIDDLRYWHDVISELMGTLL